MKKSFSRIIGNRSEFRRQWKSGGNLLFYVLLAVLPVASVYILLAVHGFRFNWSMLIPTWNDEFNGWWPQVRAMAEFGKPLGYYGYNETHAHVGTFGPWGVMPLLPYALFVKMFGQNLNSLAIANTVFLGIAMFVFCVLTKASGKEVLRLAILYLCSFITIAYSVTSMSEGSRYALAIIITGILIWMQKNCMRIQTVGIKRIVQYLLIFAFLFYAVNAYTIFALAVLIAGWFAFRGMKLIGRILLSGAITAATAIVGFKLNAAVSAPYVTSTIGNILSELKTEGLYNAACSLIRNLFTNLETVSLWGIVNQQNAAVQWYFVELISVLLLMALGIVLKIQREMSKPNHRDVLKQLSHEVLPFYFLAGFLFGYCALYTGTSGTLCRGTNTGVLMAICYSAVYPGDEDRMTGKLGKTGFTVLLLTIVGFTSIWNYHSSLLQERMVKTRFIPIIKEESKVLDGVIDISPEKSEWENTIAHYGQEDVLYLAMPAGAGLNYMIDGKPCKQSGYAVFENMCPEVERERWTEQLQNNGYSVIHKDNYFTVFARNLDSTTNEEASYS